MTGFGKLQFVSARVEVRHSRRVLRLAGIDRETDAWKANAGRSAQRDRIPLGFTAPTSPATARSQLLPRGLGGTRGVPRAAEGIEWWEQIRTAQCFQERAL